MGILKVIYKSVWEEGIVETSAKLNLETGEIFDIESSNDGFSEHFEFHEYDIISSEDGLFAEALVCQNCGKYDYSISEEDLRKFNFY